ncbi:hypothetical protein DID80_07355 [Candidatus Marinamargulisbacteria bacterium SCGC AAA071-K20]|nr:hypothetical protein DID80_07355 [Candidatus Marinamargulisbacteria bacterium SCGC AAA071-K20]
MKRLVFLLLFLLASFLCAATVTVTQGNGHVNHHQKGSVSELETIGGIASFLLTPYQESVKVDYLALSPMEVYYSIPVNESVDSGPGVSASVEAPLVGPTFNHPNPFKLKEGTFIGYQLKEDTDIEIRLFNIYGHKIWSNDYKAGQDEGAIGGKYNKVPFNSTVINNYEVSAGIYFYLIINDNTILGKGKMAIKP